MVSLPFPCPCPILMFLLSPCPTYCPHIPICHIIPSSDVKEHDVSPDNLEPVKEEPHHEEIPPAKDDLPVKGGPLNIEGDEIPQSSAEPGATEHDVEPSVGGVSGFLSGFAAAVQSTVSQLHIL